MGGIITYSEMCGRVATVSKQPVFDAVRERLGLGTGLVALVAAQIVNLLTLAAEVGGIALTLQLLSGLPYRALILLGVLALAVVIWVLPSAGSSASSAMSDFVCSCRGRRDQAPSRLG